MRLDRYLAARLACGLVVAALIAINALPAPHATLWPDTVRDVSASLSLARAEALVLVGPQINLGPHLGPAWIWLQAPGLLAAATFTAASLYVALVSGLKFLLLYRLGEALSSRRLGLCFAVAAALPSIAVYQWHVFWHPNWVEAAILATLLILWSAVRRQSLPRLYAAGLMLGLAIQLHPTALFYAPLFALALHRLGVPRRSWPLHATALAAWVAIWFLPLLFATQEPHRAKMQEGLSRVATGLERFSFAEIPTVLRTAYVDVPIAIGDTYGGAIGWERTWGVLASVAFAAVILGLARAIIVDRSRRGVVLALLAAMLLGWTIVVSIRWFTSFYLGYFLLPLACITAGLGFDQLLSGGRALRALGAAGLVATCASFALSATGAWKVGMQGLIESRLPLLMDMQHPAPGTATARWIGASARDAMARFACSERGALVLHGDWAYTLAASTDLDVRMHCPAHAGSLRLLGGAEGGNAWTLLTDMEARRVGRIPERHFRGLAAFRVKRAIHPGEARPIERDWYYFEQLREERRPARVSLAFTTSAPDLVMIYRHKPFAAAFERLTVRRDGEVVAPALTTFNSETFESRRGAQGTRWSIDFETDAPQWTDVHVF